VQLSSVADIRETGGAMNIAREAGRRATAIGIFIKDRDMGSVVKDMQARVEKSVKLPPGYTIGWSGEFENQERAMQRLTVVVPLSLLLIFVLLFDAFKSFKMAALILLNVPLALIGGFVALWIFTIPLSVSAAIGFIALSGQAVLNGVVMLSGFQQLQSEGHSVFEAVKLGSMQRLRTVLMTAMLAALGLLPMALSHDIGSETQRPLAIVIIGGLITATLLTLVVLPALTPAGDSAAPGGPGDLWITLGLTLAKVAAFVTFMLVVGRRVFPWLLKQVERTGSRELFTLAVVALALGVAFGSAVLFGVSFALGAFFAGIVIHESDQGHRAATESQPLQDLFGVLFFVSVGMLLDPKVLVQQPLHVLMVTAIIVLGKSLAAFVIVRSLGYALATALTVSAALAQIGEFSFILAGLGISLHLLPPEANNLILAGALLSITLNPLMFRVLGRWVPAAQPKNLAQA
jgi:predicted Kef-type K+ transport protein